MINLIDYKNKRKEKIDELIKAEVRKISKVSEDFPYVVLLGCLCLYVDIFEWQMTEIETATKEYFLKGEKILEKTIELRRLSCEDLCKM